MKTLDKIGETIDGTPAPGDTLAGYDLSGLLKDFKDEINVIPSKKDGDCKNVLVIEYFTKFSSSCSQELHLFEGLKHLEKCLKVEKNKTIIVVTDLWNNNELVFFKKYNEIVKALGSKLLIKTFNLPGYITID